jgi:hypothetical protein
MPVQALEKTTKSKRTKDDGAVFDEMSSKYQKISTGVAKKSLSKRRQQASVRKKRMQQEDDMSSLALSFTSLHGRGTVGDSINCDEASIEREKVPACKI